MTNIYATYGLTDRLDVGVVLPLVSSHLHGQSFAQIIPFGGPTAAHFFAGTPENPVLSATRDVDGSSFGVGDVSVRSKFKIHESDKSRVALLGEARFATGAADDLLGAGVFSARGIAVVSGVVGDFSPHANVGYAYHARTGELPWNDAVTATAGFDDLHRATRDARRGLGERAAGRAFEPAFAGAGHVRRAVPSRDPADDDPR